MEFFKKYSGTQGKLKLQVARHPVSIELSAK